MSAVMRNIQDCKQCIFTADDNIQRLFSDICDTFNTSMLRIKVLELIILMGEKRSSACEKSERIRNIGSFICENLCDHYTIAQLSGLFEIDRTTLKKLFRQTFGCPVYTYAKKIIDIAEEVGYCNASKFSSAFRDVIGTAPKNYQTERKKTRRHKNRQISTELTY